MARYYHADRVGGQFKAGQVIKLIHGQGQVPGQGRRIQHYLSQYPQGVSRHGWSYLLNKRPIPAEDQIGMIEMLAEEIRRGSYPQRLSRHQAFFGWRSVAEAESFIAKYPPKEKKGQTEIWEVESEGGAAFSSDMKLLTLGPCWLDAGANLHAYWQGRFTAEPLEEVLIPLPVQIVRKVNGLLTEGENEITHVDW